MTQHRQPTHRDISYSHVFLSNDGEEWFPGGELESIQHFGTHTVYTGALRTGLYARIPLDTTDPAAQLAVAADYLSDAGMDYAAEVLRKCAQLQPEHLERAMAEKSLHKFAKAVEMGQ